MRPTQQTVVDVINGATIGIALVAALTVAMLMGRAAGPSAELIEVHVDVAETRAACNRLSAVFIEYRLELERGDVRRDSLMAAVGFMREIRNVRRRYPWVVAQGERTEPKRGATD